jgi:hypothetical protein
MASRKLVSHSHQEFQSGCYRKYNGLEITLRTHSKPGDALEESKSKHKPKIIETKPNLLGEYLNSSYIETASRTTHTTCLAAVAPWVEQSTLSTQI